MKLPIALFLLSLAGFSFALGLVVGAYEVFPYGYIKYVLNSVETVFADRDNLMSNRPTGFLAERRYDGNGVTVYDEQQVSPGYTLLSGFFENSTEIRLIRLDGSVVQRWPVSYSTLFPNSDHIFPKSDIPASDWNAAIHGVDISPDGSVVFNFDGKGTVKLDKCGKPLWVVSRMTHHSVNRSADGSYWVPSRNMTEDDAQAYPRFKTPYRDDTVLRISPAGEVISEVSVNQILIDNGLFSLIVANGRFETKMVEDDVLHMNDIEELPNEFVASFPLFAAGDLLLSLRHLDLLLVVDPINWKVKWHHSGPWLRQHDPDFQPDGRITVLNNNSDDTKRGDIFGGSNLMSIWPASPDKAVEIIYGEDEGQYFFTNTQGKHQFLPNGNILIAEYYGGRTLEVNSRGEIVWEYVNQYDEESVAKISGAERYPESYFDVKDWTCPAD
jgi:hypothetical protein